jgi:hypothetical protein
MTDMVGMSDLFHGETGMTAQIVKVPFYGTEIHTAKVNGEPVVVLKPTIDAMGLDYSSQLKKLKGRSWATVVETATVGADGRTRRMASLDLDGWAMLLANINETKVKPELRQTVIAYQKESAKALRQFWTQGAAVNPAITEDQARVTKDRIDEILVARRKEQVDYRRIVKALSASGASDRDYAQVQETLYLGLFGLTAASIRRTRKQVSGDPYKIGQRKGQLRPSTVAKNYLRQDELTRLNSAVLMLTSALDLRYPQGEAPLDVIKLTAMQVAQVAMQGRMAVAA